MPEQHPPRRARRKPNGVVLGDFLGDCSESTRNKPEKTLPKKPAPKSQSNRPSTRAQKPPQAATTASDDPPLKPKGSKHKRKSKIHSQLQRQRLRQQLQQQQQQQEEEANHSSPAAAAAEAESKSARTLFVVRNLLQPDEMSEDDEFQDILQDIRDQMEAFGTLKLLHVVQSPSQDQENQPTDHERVENRDEQDENHSLDHIQHLCSGISLEHADIVVGFDLQVVAQQAFEALHGKKFGGEPLQCFWPQRRESRESRACYDMVVRGMVAPEELEDSDECEEVQEEVRHRFERFGSLANCCINRTSGAIHLRFDKWSAQQDALEEIDGKVFGGNQVHMEVLEPKRTQDDDIPAAAAAAAAPPPPPPPPQTVVATSPSPSLDTSQPAMSMGQRQRQGNGGQVSKLLIELLQRLSSLQERAHQKNPLHAKRTRRLVFGLREVRKFLLTHKVVCLLTAVDIAKDQGSRELDRRFDETMQLAKEDQEVLVFAKWFSRRQLMKATKKNTRISCIAVISIDGAETIFAQIKKLVSETGINREKTLILGQDQRTSDIDEHVVASAPDMYYAPAHEDPTTPETSTNAIQTP